MKFSLKHDFPWTRFVIVLSLFTFLSGCGGSWNPFKKDDEPEEVKTVKSLEVPPDLAKPETNQQFLPPGQQQAGAVVQAVSEAQLQAKISGRVAPRWQGVQRMRDGQQNWLLVNASPEQVWPLINKFVKGRGYSIAQNEPAIGIMETAWVETSDADVSLRENLRVRVEPHREAGRTEVFVNIKSSEKTADGQWRRGVSDDERSVEMLNRLAQYLGANKIDDTPQAMPATAATVAPAARPAVAPAAASGMTAKEIVADVKAEIEAEEEAERQQSEETWKEIEKKCPGCPPIGQTRVPK